MNSIEWIATVASVCTIVSFALNVAQFVIVRKLRAEAFLRLQGLYSSFFDVAALVDIVLSRADETAARALHEIRGLSDAARHDIVSTCQSLSGKLPRYQHPAGQRFSDSSDHDDPHQIIDHKRSHFPLHDPT